jgi:regulator of sigma E protease
MAGEEDPKASRSLAGKPIRTRLLVLSAGSLMNIILPLLLFSIAFMVPHNVVEGQVIITDIAPNSPAATAGIESGDTLLSINGKPIRNIGDLHRYIQLNLGKETAILVQHSDSATEEIRVIPRWQPPQGQGAVGITVNISNPTIVRQQEPPWRAAPLAASACIETFVLFKNGILSMIIGAVPVEVTGPVGIAQITGVVARAGFSPLMEFAAFLSINLAVINIFPLPGLDGGRIAFVLLEKVRRGKRVSPKTEGLIHFIGFAALIGVIMVITYHDIIRIMSGVSIMP